MSFDKDILVASLQKIEASKGQLFDHYHPVISKILKKNGTPPVLDRAFTEFVLVPVSPERVTRMRHGTEIIKGGRRTGSVKGNSYAERIIYSYDVPIKMLADVSSKQELGRIIEMYPLRSRINFMERIVRQIVMGNEPDMGGILTLNGEQQYDPDGNVRDGVFEFEDPANQTGSPFNVTKNSIPGWYHQRRHINGFDSEGRFRLRQAFYDCAEQGTMMRGRVDCMIADRGTYDNYVAELEGLIAIDTKSITHDTAPGEDEFRDGVPFDKSGKVRMYSEQAIRLNEFSSADAQDGVVYGLNSRTWHMFRKGGGQNTTNGWFADKKVKEAERQEVLIHASVLHMGMYCDDLRRNFVVTGGAIR